MKTTLPLLWRLPPGPILLGACFLICISPKIRAQDTVYTWAGASGHTLWSDGASWSGGVSPVSSPDNAILFNTTGGLSSSETADNFQINSITFGSGAGAFTLTGGRTIEFVDNSTGTAPTLTSNASTGTNVQTIDNGIILDDTLTIGGTGTNAVIFNGGIVQGLGGITVTGAYTFALEAPETYTGTTTVNAGTLTLQPRLGVPGAVASLTNSAISIGAGGTFNIANGATVNTEAKAFQVGTSAGTLAATANLFNTGSITGAEMDLGTVSGATAVFNHSEGTVSLSNLLSIGAAAGASGTYNLGDALSAPQINVGDNGTGTLTQTSGTINASTITIGNNLGSSGTFALSGGTVAVTAVVVGLKGTGAVIQTGGSITINSDLDVGKGNTGTYMIADASAVLSITGNLDLGGLGNGAFTQTLGTVSVNTLNLGALANGTYNLNGGTLTAKQIAATTQSGGSGIFNLEEGGVLNLAATSSSGSKGQNTFNFNGGLLVAAGNVSTTVPLFEGFSVNVQAGGAVIDNGGYSVAFAALQHDPALGASLDGGLLANGNGTLILTATGTYTGGTIVAGGTLSIQATNAAGAGAITLQGGELLGNAGISNNVNLQFQDTIAALASRVLTINGDISFVGSTPAMVTIGDTANTGTVAAAGDLNLGGNAISIVTGATFDNQGSVEIAGGSITGAGTMANDGTLSGSGTIGLPFSNAADGVIAVNAAGNLKITSAFTNSGLISLNANTALLTGGAITNAGQIEGFGNVKNNISNTGGAISAAGGTLDLTGVVINSSGGTISAGGTVGTGEVLVAQGLATNAGVISLAGGEFNNNNHALANTGAITGYGIFTTGLGGLTTSGAVDFAGGAMTVDGAVAVTGGTVDIYNTANFNGPVTITQGAVTTHSASAVFAKGLSVSGGSFVNDPSTTLTTDLIIGVTGTVGGEKGSLYQVSGDVANASTQNQLGTSELEFIAPGDTANHAHSLLWTVSTGHTDIGQLTLDSGETLQTDSGGAGLLTVDVLQLSQVMSLSSESPGGLLSPSSLATAVDQALTAGDLPIYYNPSESANAYLEDQTIPYGNGGELIATPEPGTAISLLSGMVMLLGWRRRRAFLTVIPSRA
jgi:fibronectin-binding autotransporter adhesin